MSNGRHAGIMIMYETDELTSTDIQQTIVVLVQSDTLRVPDVLDPWISLSTSPTNLFSVIR
jgi:hypothetical protein